MKKNFLKSTFVVAIMAASATVGYMAYNQHQNQQLAFANPLLAENLEALADNPGASSNQDSPDWDDLYDVKGDPNGKCIKFVSKHAFCPERGAQPDYHGKRCEIVTYSSKEEGYTYRKKQVLAAINMFFVIGLGT